MLKTKAGLYHGDGAPYVDPTCDGAISSPVTHVVGNVSKSSKEKWQEMHRCPSESIQLM